MKAIKICIDNKDAIETALRNVNGAHKEYTFTTYAEIEHAAYMAENKLDNLHLPLKERHGATAHALSGKNVAKSYKYTRIGTSVKLYRGYENWFLTDVNGRIVFQSGGNHSISLTRFQDSLAICALRELYTIGDHD